MLKTPSESDDRPRASSATARGIETVLVVEDEEPVRMIARKILENFGYRVIEADGPEQALALAAAAIDPIHLLLTDVVMPHMDGHQLALRLAELRPDIRVLFMSGYADAPERYGPLDRRRFLQKPFTPADLTRMAREAIDARDWS